MIPAVRYCIVVFGTQAQDVGGDIIERFDALPYFRSEDSGYSPGV